MRRIACVCFAVLLAGCGSNVTDTDQLEARAICEPLGFTPDMVDRLFTGARNDEDAGTTYDQIIIEIEAACDGDLDCNTCATAVADAVYN